MDFQDPILPLAARVADLIGRLTLDDSSRLSWRMTATTRVEGAVGDHQPCPDRAPETA